MYKTIDGDLGQAAPALAVGMSKLRELAKHDYFVNQTFMVDGAMVRISHNPAAQAQYIHVTSAPTARYEFFTSDSGGEYDAYESPGFPGVIVGHAAKVNFKTTSYSAAMLISYNGLNNAPVFDPGSSLIQGGWPYTAWVSRFAYNDQRIQPFTEYTVSTTGKLLYTTFPVKGAPTSFNLPATYGTAYAAQYGYGLSSDVGWDVRQPVYRGGKLLASLQPLLPRPYWWRRGKTVEVRDENGVAHPFSIVTDAMSNFYVFRTNLSSDNTLKHDGYDAWYVTPGNYRKIPAASVLPEWAEVPTINTMREGRYRPLFALVPVWDMEGVVVTHEATLPTGASTTVEPQTGLPGGDPWAGSPRIGTDVYQEWEHLWSFNSDGTAASAIVVENCGVARYPMYAETDTNPISNYMHPIKTMRWGFPDVIVPPLTESANGGFAANGGLKDHPIRRRGLASVSIAITVTGDGPMDFTATVTPTGGVKDKYYTDVAYAMDLPELAAKGVAKDALLTTELEVFRRAADGLPILQPTSNLGEQSLYGVYTTRCDGVIVQRWLMAQFDRYYVNSHRGYLSNFRISNWAIEGSPYGRTIEEDLPLNAMMYTILTHGPNNLDGSIGPMYLGTTLIADDLKSLSFIVRTSEDSVYLKGGLHLYVKGSLVESSGNVGVGSLVPPEDIDTLVKLPIYPGDANGLHVTWPEVVIPYDYLAMYNQFYSHTISTRPVSFVNTHPSGSYSAYAHHVNVFSSWAGPDLVIDTIVYNSDKGQVKTTHREAFNSAYEQSREYADNLAGASNAFGRFGTGGTWV